MSDDLKERLVSALLAEYNLKHATETDRLPRCAAVRGVAVRTGVYVEFLSALDMAVFPSATADDEQDEAQDDRIAALEAEVERLRDAGLMATTWLEEHDRNCELGREIHQYHGDDCFRCTLASELAASGPAVAPSPDALPASDPALPDLGHRDDPDV